MGITSRSHLRPVVSKTCFILSLVPNVLETNAVLLQLRTQQSCRLDLLPNDFLLFTHLGVYSDFDITLETSSLQGCHIKECGDTLSDNTYVRACSFFHSAGHERYRCCLLHKAQDEFPSSGKASCLVVFYPF